MEDNKYLEKIAGWRSKLEQTTAGKAMGNLNGATNASVLASLGQSKPTGSFNAGSKKMVGTGGFLGVGKKKTLVNTGATKATGDALASGKSLAERAKDFKASNVSKGAGGKGILGKAIGIAKRNPIATAVAGGIGAGMLIGGRSKNDQYQY